jgi:aminoglycoside 2''-phosphotransferase
MSMDSFELLSLIETETPVEVKKHRFIREGWDNVVVEVNDTLIFRFLRREEVQSQFLKEIDLLPVLKNSLSLSVPQPIYVRSDKSPYFMGYKKIEGVHLRPSHVNNFMENVSTAIGNFLTELHNVEEDELTRIEYYDPSAWKAQYQLLYNRIENKLSERFNRRIWRRIQYVFNTYLSDSENFIFKPVLCHRDLSSEHILHIIGNLTGVIDWGDACFGDPAFDLTGLYSNFGRSFAENICRRVELPPTYLERTEFYVMVIPFYEALYGLDTEKNYRFENGVARIKTVFG